MAKALIVAQDTIKRTQERAQMLSEQNELLAHKLDIAAPKVQYFNDVLMSESTYNTNQLAKELGMSAITLNRKLHDLGIQSRQGEQWLLYHKYQNRGYTKTHGLGGSSGTAYKDCHI